VDRIIVMSIAIWWMNSSFDDIINRKKFCLSFSYSLFHLLKGKKWVHILLNIYSFYFSNETRTLAIRSEQKNQVITESNRFEPVFVLKNQTETGRFEPVSVFFKKNLVWLFFFIKTEPNSKWSSLLTIYLFNDNY
jgi:hypothetical protein